MNSLDNIITLLTERASRDGCWSLTLTELEDLLDPVTLYRSVYELQLIGRDTYNESSAGQLVGLLESAVSPGAEDAMRAAGLFLNHEDRIALTERFVRHLQRAIVLHLPEVEIFRGMISQFRQYDIAEQVYCETYLNPEPVRAACATEDAEGRARPEVHRLTAAWYLGTLLDRRIVTLQDLGPALFELLRTVGRQEGVLPGLSDRRRGSDTDIRAGDELAAARDLFGLSGDRISRERIQTEYRRLMRRYHPDVNPDGLEMAKRINAAYSVLLTSEDRH